MIDLKQKLKEFRELVLNKLDKINNTDESPKVYVANPDGSQSAAELSSSPKADAIPIYTKNGAIKQNTPIDDDESVNKKYVDDALKGISFDADKMTFKSITVSTSLPTEDVKMGDTYYLLDKNVFAVAYVYEGNVNWFKSAVEVPAYLDLSKTMSFKGMRFPLQGLPTNSVFYGDTYFVGNGPDDSNGYFAVAYVDKSNNVIWWKTPSVKATMCDGKGDAWTDTERLAALLRLGCTVDENGFVKWTAQDA